MTIILEILNCRTVDVVLGAVLAIGFAFLVECFRRPRLTMSIEVPPLEQQLPNVGIARHVRVIVSGKPLPKGMRWMMRGPASQFRAVITFHHLDGQNVFGRAMPVRWSDTDQPVHIVSATPQGQPIALANLEKALRASRVDIYPGEKEPLDVAVRIDNDQDCYGWNNESYLHEWRNPDWRIPPPAIPSSSIR
jgi:hypothetical protein